MQAQALVEGPDHVCYRYRVAAFRSALAEKGITLKAVPLERPALSRSRQLRCCVRADVVILQRKLLPLWQLRILRRWARRLIYDVDDAVFQRDSYSRKPRSSVARLARFWATVYAADAVIAGNDYLGERVASYVEPQRVHVIPTCVEPGRYSVPWHHREGAVSLVWVGQRSTLPSLRLAQPRLAAAAGRLPGLELRMISDRFCDLAGVRCVPRPWSSATEAAELADADIGIAWLPDDPWSQGKCGLKVLQYMAAGLPVVANPVGIHRQMVIDGRTGLLASTPAEWAEAICSLASSAQLRQRLGNAGRRLVEQRYHAARWGRCFARVVASVADHASHGARPAASLPSGGMWSWDGPG